MEYTLKNQSAMSITHFQESPPKESELSNLTTGENVDENNTKENAVNRKTDINGGLTSPQVTNGAPSPRNTLNSETYALILGYKDDDIEELKKCIQSCKETIFNPFTLIKGFLRVERGHRFKEVDRKIVHFQNILQNYGRLPFGADSSKQPQELDGNKDDPKNLIGLYLEVYVLKIRLMAWTSQITGLKKYSSEFTSFTPSQHDIDPEEYLQRLVDEYEVKINKCEMVLQGASLAFQMVHEGQAYFTVLFWDQI